MIWAMGKQGLKMGDKSKYAFNKLKTAQPVNIKQRRQFRTWGDSRIAPVQQEISDTKMKHYMPLSTAAEWSIPRKVLSCS